MDLTGKWDGYYEQDGGQHGIEMQVRQRDMQLRGTMRDRDTLLMGGLNADDAAHLRDRLESDGSDEPQHITSLPADSIIEGKVRGDHFTFVKHYLGPQQSDLWIDDIHVEIEIHGHGVHYGGVIAEDGAVLRGEWCIQSPAGADGKDEDNSLDEEEGVEERGAFELRRVGNRTANTPQANTPHKG